MKSGFPKFSIFAGICTLLMACSAPAVDSHPQVNAREAVAVILENCMDVLENTPSGPTPLCLAEIASELEVFDPDDARDRLFLGVYLFARGVLQLADADLDGAGDSLRQADLYLPSEAPHYYWRHRACMVQAPRAFHVTSAIDMVRAGIAMFNGASSDARLPGLISCPPASAGIN